MSLRRATTVSPLIGCPSNASPPASQSRRSPASKSRLSDLPSADFGRNPCGESAFGFSCARPRTAAAKTTNAVQPQSNLERIAGLAPVDQAFQPDRSEDDHPLRRRLDHPRIPAGRVKVTMRQQGANGSVEDY